MILITNLPQVNQIYVSESNFVKSRYGAHLTLAGALTEPSDIKSKMIFDEFGNIFTHLD